MKLKLVSTISRKVSASREAVTEYDVRDSVWSEGVCVVTVGGFVVSPSQW